MSKMEELLKTWQEFFDYQVVGTQEYAPFLLHSFLGDFVDTKHIRGGHAFSPKVHIFIIQDGSTGKGECSNAFEDIARRYNKVLVKGTDFTVASLAGSYNEKTGKETPGAASFANLGS